MKESEYKRDLIIVPCPCVYREDGGAPEPECDISKGAKKLIGHRCFQCNGEGWLDYSSYDDDDSDDSDDDDTVDPNQISGTVKDLFTEVFVPFATVEVVDNDTGQSLIPPVVEVADENGYVLLTVPEDQADIGIKVSKTDYIDTYKYDYVLGTADVDFMVTAYMEMQIMASFVEETLDPLKGHVAGGVEL